MAAVQIIRFGVDAPAAETGKPGNVISGAPQTSVQNYYTDKGGEFFSGVWESTPGKWTINYTEDEFCIILEGRAVLTDESGKVANLQCRRCLRHSRRIQGDVGDGGEGAEVLRDQRAEGLGPFVWHSGIQEIPPPRKR